MLKKKINFDWKILLYSWLDCSPVEPIHLPQSELLEVLFENFSQV
jgi:hypothetical protein